MAAPRSCYFTVYGLYLLRRVCLTLFHLSFFKPSLKSLLVFLNFKKCLDTRAEMSGPGIRENLWAGRILSLHPFFWSSTVLHVMLGKMCFIKFHLNSFKRCILIQKLRSMKIGAVRVVRCTIFYCSVMIRCFQKTVFLAAVQCTVRTGCTALSL